VDATEWDARYAERELVWSATPNATVEAELAELAPGRALDLACGEGRNAIWLAERGWDVEAVDFSEVALDKARSLARSRGVEVRWRPADLTVPPRFEPADAVLVAYLHLPRLLLRAVHRTAAGAVAPGGILLIVGHARANLEHGTGGPQDPDLLLEIGEVEDDLAGTGLVVERSEEIDREVEADEGPRTAIDVVLRARRPR
jgi:SAM-dependent methyltransferase